MLISPEQEALIDRVFETYLMEHHHGDILRVIADTNEETHRPVFVNAMTLFEASMEVGDYFNAFPSDVLAIFDKVLHRLAMELSESASPKHSGVQRTKELKRHSPHARITGLPVCPEMTRDTIPRSRDVGHFLSVTGTVIRTSVTKVLEYERDYICAKCRHVFSVQADFDQFYTFVQLIACPNPDGCNSNKFSCLSGGSEPTACKDYQEIKIQEQVQRLSVGSIPRSMVVVLEDDLVDSCKSGDDVTIYGVMCQRWKPFYDSTQCNVELVLKANNIEVKNQQAAAALVTKDVQKEFEDFWNSYKHDPIAGRNQILLSLCPQVFGMYLIKLAVAMVLAGGVQRIDSSGTKIRGECHMLLVGDPGTGKSQFLKYAAKIMPRSVLTAGIGSTSAGLTVAAVKDGVDWHLEAGALVLSDGGLCCIDEFNSIKEHDRISIHEAMEQQSISVAKAGMVCKLNTRTSILAATNPKGQYDPNEPLSVNVALASPLLSRFDLVLVLMDTRNAEWDRIISSFILEDRGVLAESASLWSMEKMKAYFSVIKCLQPQVSEEANGILTRYYQLQRQSHNRNTARTTIRMLESLSRLAEAHARLMYRETVTIEDAVMAVSVMECSMQFGTKGLTKKSIKQLQLIQNAAARVLTDTKKGGALLGNVNALLTSFPADPGQQYQNQCQILLEGLNLPLLLQKEMDRMARLKSNTSDASPPTDIHQHRHRDTIPVNITYHHDITDGDGLDWFRSITSPVFPDGLASPMITSTQEPLKKTSRSEMSTITKQPDCRTEKDIQSKTSSTFNYEKVSKSINSASGNENQAIEKNENMEEESFIAEEETGQSEKQKDKNHPESLECVFQKVSKNMRDRRLMELELKHQQAVGHGDGATKNVGAALNITSNMKRSSAKCSPRRNFSSNNLAQDNLSSGKDGRSVKKDKRCQTGTKTISTLRQEELAAETETRNELHAKLSGFMFKPKKIRSSVRDRDVSAQFQSECYPGIHTENGGKSEKQPVSHDDSARPRTNTEKNERQKQNQTVSEGGSRKKQASCVSKLGDSRPEASTTFTSKELDRDVFSSGEDSLAQGKAVSRIKRTENTENLSRQQRERVNICDETPVNSITCNPLIKPSTCISNPQPSKKGHTKSTVASSTLSKLSRFSFICTNEPTTTAQSEVEKNPAGVGEVPLTRDNAECLRGNTRDTKAVHVSKHSHEQGTESSRKKRSEYKEKQVAPTYSANHRRNVKTMNYDHVDHDNTVNVNKRKCFELGPATSSVFVSRVPFSGLSLFGCAELGDDVLDTDWDREVSKKAKS